MLKKLIQESESLRQLFKRNKHFKLKDLSRQLIEEAALSDDRLKALMALIAYSLYKLSSKGHITKNPKWDFAKKEILQHLDKAVQELKSKDFREFESQLRLAVESISRIDSEISNYAHSTFEKARAKLASNAYALGLSLGQAAALTGADKKDLLNYIGFTRMHDEAGVGLGIKERLKNLEEVLSA
ncbi:MAG: hypothetical protein J4478_01205 [Candidatus Diapherotrites archaeon]|uniref:Uncharacterized protein n=1 Tax=Candidatus Iainarchaeum sp. TaxID=3101447 RepID=A0A7J4JZ91_9ARCH|nr:hypothetical protein [Candidatus Diapherotrites archaeon]HIH21575.1 hypothetical protein [Candidatus Diapherotrites archaeon]